jgi:TIR domain-containing protein
MLVTGGNKGAAMSVIKPQIFVSYSHRDMDYVQQLRRDLLSGNVDCWLDDTVQTGDKLSPVIEDAISRSSLFFAYITKAYLESRWCMKEFRYALEAPEVTVVPYTDSEATLHAVPGELMDEVVFGTLSPESYAHSLMQLVGRSWASLQTFQRVVPADNHILAGPAIFDSAGYTRNDLMARTKRELILAGGNLRSWMSDEESKRGLVALVQERHVRVSLILATYETLRPISPEGSIHLRESVKDIRQMTDRLAGEEKNLMRVYFHVGAATLSAVFIDPDSPNGLLFFSPRWAIQWLPQDRLNCVIDKTINSEGLFKAIYNGVLLMRQGDAKSLEEMVAETGKLPW